MKNVYTWAGDGLSFVTCPGISRAIWRLFYVPYSDVVAEIFVVFLGRGRMRLIFS